MGVKNNRKKYLMKHKLSDFFEYNLFKAGLFSEGSLQNIASSNVGIHSARITSPYVLCCSRNSSFRPQHLFDHLYITKDLIKLRCMRTTLHIVNVSEAPVYHMATKKLRIKIEQTKLKKLGVSDSLVDKVKNKLGDVLSEPLSPEQIYSLLDDKTLSKPACNAVIKYLWEDGFLCYVNVAKDWKKEERKFAVTSKFYNGLDLNSISEDHAQKQLFINYLEQFGPVCLKDASWWSGISQTTIKNIWEGLEDIITFDIDGVTYYMQSSDYSKFLQYNPPRNYVKLLAYEDSALKAYYISRTRYADSLLQQKIFNIIGEVMPTIIYNGKVVGKWSYNKKTNSPDYELFTTLPKLAQKLFKREADSYICRLNKGKQLGFFIEH